MRCIACGMEMRFLRTAPYRSMVSAGELHIFECPRCQRTEQRLAPKSHPEPLSGERMELPPAVLPLLGRFAHNVSVVARNAWLQAAPRLRQGFSSASALLNHAMQELLVAYNAGTRYSAMLRGRLLAACSASLISAQHNAGGARDRLRDIVHNARARLSAQSRALYLAADESCEKPQDRVTIKGDRNPS